MAMKEERNAVSNMGSSPAALTVTWAPPSLLRISMGSMKTSVHSATGNAFDWFTVPPVIHMW